MIADVLIRKARDFKAKSVTVGRPVLPTRRYRPQFERRRIRCYDRQTAISYCTMQRELGRCFMQTVIDDCRYTCGECDSYKYIFYDFVTFLA